MQAMAYVKLNDSEARSPREAGWRLPSWLLVAVLGTYAVASMALTGTAGPTRPAAADNAFRLSDRLPSALVTVRTAGTPERPCKWHPGDRLFTCSDEGYAFVGPYAGFAAGRPLRCTWMHPLAGGSTTILRWPDVAFGDRVSGRVALLDDVGPGAEVRMQIVAAGQPIASVGAVESRQIGQFDDAIAAGPPRGELRLELSASDHAWRLACVELLMTGRRKPGAQPAVTEKPLDVRPISPIRLPRAPMGGRP